jgi:glycosyltransferase involved in cell wall biosynthesis
MAAASLESRAISTEFPHTLPFSGVSVPRASVVICAHNRREYLRAAVDSVLAQDVERSLFEIIVVKNFQDETLDSYLTGVGARIIDCDKGPVTHKVAVALEHCSGNLILLLDDDDLFEPGKLRTVFARFDADPKLGFYHNRFRYIGPGGEPLSNRAVRPFGLRSVDRSRRLYVDPADRETELWRLAYSYPDFNISSWAFRRDAVSDGLPYLERLNGALDTFLLFQGLLSPYALLMDDAILTRYRVHGTNMTLAGGANPEARRRRLLDASGMLERSYTLIKEMILRSGKPQVVRQLEGRLLVNRLSGIFRDTNSRRLDAVKAVIEAVRLRDTYAVRENIASWAGACLFSVAPNLARRVYDRQMSI